MDFESIHSIKCTEIKPAETRSKKTVFCATLLFHHFPFTHLQLTLSCRPNSITVTKFNELLGQGKQLCSVALHLPAHENLLTWSACPGGAALRACPCPAGTAGSSEAGTVSHLQQLQLPPATGNMSHTMWTVWCACLFFHTMTPARLAALIIIFPSSWPIFPYVWGIILEWPPGFEKPNSLHGWHLCKMPQKKILGWNSVRTMKKWLARWFLVALALNLEKTNQAKQQQQTPKKLNQQRKLTPKITPKNPPTNKKPPISFREINLKSPWRSSKGSAAGQTLCSALISALINSLVFAPPAQD